jgi:hypothetical protein
VLDEVVVLLDVVEVDDEEEDDERDDEELDVLEEVELGPGVDTK